MGIKGMSHFVPECSGEMSNAHIISFHLSSCLMEFFVQSIDEKAKTGSNFPKARKC